MIIKFSSIVFKTGIFITTLFFALNIKMPVLYKIRQWEVEILLLLLSLNSFLLYKNILKDKNRRAFKIIKKCELAVIIFVSFFSLSIFSYNHYQHNAVREVILNADKDQLEKIGKHFIIGYRDDNFSDIQELVKRRAIGGVYLTKRNIKGKTSFEIKKEIEILQNIQRGNNLPDLLIATDQEGGLVSRFSPPLTQLPTLSTIVKDSKSDKELRLKVVEYAELQSRELSDIGINLNFSPVVDLKNSSIEQVLNLHTRTDLRAISNDKDIVTKVALIYSRISEKNRVIPTLKHFPGLAMVSEDTHLFEGKLKVNENYLSKNDWVPFRTISKKTGAFIMLGHVILEKMDRDSLVSCSKTIVKSIIREKWNHTGILITDDLNMGPVVKSKGGIGGFSVRSLNAGVDYLLISYDGEQYYKAINSVINADNNGSLDNSVLNNSNLRITKLSKNNREPLITAF
ncbi:MAG: glycoside hydrolase family 3 protein [Deltaproteobacteria bacterium]|nr:glycoside hydrolase family 3 protein [Deltaproteobacteria bacterium]